nr:unnamed protein product [Callosobruchus analis]
MQPDSVCVTEFRFSRKSPYIHCRLQLVCRKKGVIVLVVYEEAVIVFNIVKIFAPRQVKLARDSLNIDREQQGGPQPTPVAATAAITPDGGNQEWKRFVGSIRRKVQRHASGGSSSSSSANVADSALLPTPSTSAQQAANQSLARKNSLTMFRREKSQDRKQPVQKQKSIGSEGKDLLKAFSFRDKAKGNKEAEPKKKATPSKAVGGGSGRGKGGRRD